MPSSFTPGPWTFIPDHYSDSAVVVDAGGFQHVEAHGPVAVLLDYSAKLGIPHWADSPAASREIGEEEQAANARLIAASPTMLATLQDMDGWLANTGHNIDHPWRVSIRAAIAAATGAAQ